MVASLKASAYLVDGDDLAAAAAKLTHDGAGLYSGLAETIGVSTAAGANGGTIAGGVFTPYTHSTMYLVRANGPDAVWAAVRALRRRCKPGRTVTLTRQMPDPDGTDANTDQVTTGRRQTDRVAWFGVDAMQVDIDWLITGGPWIGDQLTIASAAGTQTVAGDLPTQKIVATLSAGAASPVVENDNGFSFRYVGTVPAGGVEVDVETRRATKVADSSDVSSALRWAKAAPFQLDPDDNVITVSAGTCALDYYPAYQ